MRALVLLAALENVTRCGLYEPATLDVRYPSNLTPPTRPMTVYHLGHSLVGQDMPAMLEQLAGPMHRHHSQLGWGTTLRAHWDATEGRTLGITGFEALNLHPHFRPAHDAIGSGQYDAVVMTEMVEIRDAIQYYDSPYYLYRWAQTARRANPQIRLYLYETWHPLDDPEGWLNRIDRDLHRYWEERILDRAQQRSLPGGPIYLVPGGQVLARFVREIDARGGVGNVLRREDLFARMPDGSVDPIHLNDIGMYLIALTHYAVLYLRSPVGLSHQLRRADGAIADAPTGDAAHLMQTVVWEVVTHTPGTGVRTTP